MGQGQCSSSGGGRALWRDDLQSTKWGAESGAGGEEESIKNNERGGEAGWRDE